MIKHFSALILVLLCSCRSSDDNSLSPIDRLKTGNLRFMSGEPIHPHETLQRIRELKKGQHPFAVIVSCSDSRVPPELIFDQGLGDLFSVRTAGNIIGDYELGSIEYAVEHLGCKQIVVLGHEDCGAVKAYLENRGCYEHLDHIRNLIEYIAEEEEEQSLVNSGRLQLESAVEANIRHGVHLLKNSEPVLKRLLEENEISVSGALYDLDEGSVLFFEE